jgi:hypothetical protein
LSSLQPLPDWPPNNLLNSPLEFAQAAFPGTEQLTEVQAWERTLEGFANLRKEDKTRKIQKMKIFFNFD